MIARIQKAKNEDGFTLIELLVVMIIIGILAAIAIPIFLSQREKAQDSAAKADVSTLGKEVATWYVDNTADPSLSTSGGFYTIDSSNVARISDGVTLGTPSFTSPSDWCVTVDNDGGSVAAFEYSSDEGLQEGDCS